MLKLILHQPRPIWVWNDLLTVSCDKTFGAPSGHSYDVIVFTLILILDHFFASQWTRQNFPDLCKLSITSNSLSFIAISIVGTAICAITSFDIIVLGRHALNQIVLGAIIGVWVACFQHFVLRDFIYYHIARVTWNGPKLSKEDAGRYGRTAALIGFGIIAIVVSIAIIASQTVVIEQEWLLTTEQVCGYEYVRTKEGLLIPDSAIYYDICQY